MLKRGAGWIAAANSMPTAVRAVFGYYAETGVFDAGSLQLQRRVDAAVAEMIDEAFSDVGEALASEFGHDDVTFDYDTKLVLPAKLTLGYLYRRLDEPAAHDAETFTQLAVEALLDGDMRDALNDDEYDDFEVDFEARMSEKKRIAEIAQKILQARVDDHFSRYSEETRDIYEWAVDISEAHQEEDKQFRELMAGTRDGDEQALSEIRRRYKYGEFEEEVPTLFTEAERDLPYLKTQYDRVGVIYDAMIEMYRSADFEIEATFQRSIVLAIIGAQIWLDDLDDYEDDLCDGQLTPVTAEYLLAETGIEAKQSVIEISEMYIERARTQATTVDSTLTGIATEYIYRDGEPEKLPTTLPMEMS